MENSAITNLYRQIKMMLGIGRVTAMSDSGTVQSVQYQTPLEVRDDTPRLAEFGFSSGLPVGTDVVIGFLGGDRSSAVIIGSNHQSYRHTALNSGEVVIYDQWGQYVKLTQSGIEVQANNQLVTVNNATMVTINASDDVTMNTPLLRVSGDIIDNAGSNNSTVKQLRDQYNAHQHAVNNVQGGNSSVISEKTGASA